MAENNGDRAGRIAAAKEFRLRVLLRETGITEAQAHELMDLIGNDGNSLLREARLLARSRSSRPVVQTG